MLFNISLKYLQATLDPIDFLYNNIENMISTIVFHRRKSQTGLKQDEDEKMTVSLF